MKTRSVFFMILLTGIAADATHAQSNPAAASAKSTAPATTPVERRPLKIVMLGDSLTAGYGIDKAKAYPALVQAEYKQLFPDAVEIINAGISGSTTASAVKRLSWQLRGKDKPDILVLALGGNDGLRGLEVAAAKKNLAAAVQLAKDNGITVLLAGMKIPPNYGKTYTEDFEKMYGELAKQHDVALIPFLLEGVGGEDSLNLPDGIHPNEKGHLLIAEIVSRHLKPLVEKALQSARPSL